VLLSINVSAQINKNADPGFSVHNYKQPHKAKLAKKMESRQDNPQIDVTVEPRMGNRFNHTPKYAARPASIIVGATQSGKEFNLNPLDSPHHYKSHELNGADDSAKQDRLAVKSGKSEKDNGSRID
jgi:hypothetical protein